ncbi:hypothetical protein SDC9_104346 [bioreactor metagenome]|uniref:Uncharacterized protein n=1 Tax=bioreactor metagenome TaxID=1076179 RepID=A0A645B742_9ZZZZ
MRQHEVVRQTGQPAHALVACAEGGLDASECNGAAVADLQRHFHGCALQVLVWHHLVDQAQIQGFTGCELFVEHPDFLGLFLADQVF